MRDEQEAMWPDYRGFYLPKTLDKSILFTGPQLQQLLDRQKELEQECATLNENYKQSTKLFNKKKKEVDEQ